MGRKLGYFARETFRNLRRNLTLTLASILTVAVSLGLLGIALLLQRGVAQATDRWEDGVEFIVFMQPEASGEQDDRIRALLGDDPEVNTYRYVDQDEAYAEYLDLFAGTDLSQIEGLVTPDILPPSYRVVPLDVDAEAVKNLADRFEGEAGVKDVVAATEGIRKIQSASNVIRWFVFGAAVVLLGTGLLLIFNTIRMAMFARRREIEVMKLVGATNMFILVPFMLEGMIQGVLGAGLGIGAVWGLNKAFREWLSAGEDALQIFQSFAVENSEVLGIGVWLLILGAAVGTIGSAIAAFRFLDV